MAITYDKLLDGTKARAVAMFAEKTAGADKYVLPNEDLGIITEMINEGNPLAWYTGVTVSGQGSGTVEVKYDIYNDAWVKKTEAGSTVDTTQIANQVIDDEVFKWNTSNKWEEKLSAMDISRGVPNMLGTRMAFSSKKFLQASIKEAFRALVEHTGDSQASYVDLGALDFSTRDALTSFKIKMLQAISKFCIENEIDESEFALTLDAATFDALAEQGLIGDRATMTYAGGRFTVGRLGSYAVQSGSMFLPATTGATTAVPLYAIGGTNKLALHAIDWIAANEYALGGSNDRATYLEIADIFGALDYFGKFGKPQGVVFGNGTPDYTPVTP